MIYLKNKWVAIVAVLLFSLLSASRIAGFVRPLAVQAVPVVNEAVKPFLPIEIKNGEVVGEARVVKSAIPFPGGQAINIVLDTGVDAFNVNDLKGQGIYVSKKNIYIAKGTETTVRSLSAYGNMTIDEQSMQSFSEYMIKISEYSFAFFFVTFLIFVPIAVLIYALFTYLVLLLLAKSPFSQVYAVSSIVYSALGILALYSSMHAGMLMTFIILVVANYICAKVQE